MHSEYTHVRFVMKKIETYLILGLVFVLTSLTLHAIPNSVGGILGNGGFVNIAGIRFENFAEAEDTWKPNAKLMGKWEDWKDPKIQDSSVLIYRLNLTADVFGVRASQVTAQMKDDKVVRFNVVFEKSSSQSGSLIAQLKTNIQSYTGVSGSADKKSFDYKKINIQLKSASNGSVVVVFTPKASAVAVR